MRYVFRGVTCKSRFYKEGRIVFGSSLGCDSSLKYSMGVDSPFYIARHVALRPEEKETLPHLEEIPVRADSVSIIIEGRNGEYISYPLTQGKYKFIGVNAKTNKLFDGKSLTFSISKDYPFIGWTDPEEGEKCTRIHPNSMIISIELDDGSKRAYPLFYTTWYADFKEKKQ